jgi:hypothetical protein
MGDERLITDAIRINIRIARRQQQPGQFTFKGEGVNWGTVLMTPYDVDTGTG